MAKPPAAETGLAKHRLAPAVVLAAALSIAWPTAPLAQEVSFFREGAWSNAYVVVFELLTGWALK